jgi:predicted Zn-dependent protease
MLSRSKIDSIVDILKKDARRAMRMRARGFPKPYYCAFLLRDFEWFNTWASSGSMYRKRSDRTRSVYCDIRVGSYRYDQTTDGGLFDNDDEVESFAYVRVPIDDKCFDGLRISLWKLSESKYREACTDFSNKEAARLSTLNPNRKFASFHKLTPVRHVQYSRPEKVDEQKWIRFCKNASKYISEFKGVTGNYVEFDASQESKIFVSTEGRIIVQHQMIFTLSASIRRLTEKGSQLEQDIVINCATQKELPDLRAFKARLKEKYEQLMDLVSAKKIHSFSGPVLLNPIPAGLLFHEAVGHRLEGSRLLSSGEGQTFKNQEGKKIIGIPIDIVDDPTRKTFQGKRCIGHFEYDDEGTPTSPAVLIEDGILQGFLNSRAAIPAKNNQMNGHARNAKYQRPISRMGVTVVTGKDPVPASKLKELLIEEIIRQKKPFGMIVYETAGGETDTTAYDFQAFAGEISFATLVYPDGSEVVVRGVDFVGTPLQALSNVIAVGDVQVLDNHYCGAESGFIPVSTICPAVLLSNLELQAKEEELVTQYLLPRPRL